MNAKEILLGDDEVLKRGLLEFDSNDSDKAVIVKFNLWVRYLFPKQFRVKDASFHRTIDLANLAVYRGNKEAFYNSAYRGSAKTTRTKLFVAFCICCDKEQKRKYFKVLTKDVSNSKQIVTDLYNILINNRLTALFGGQFGGRDNKKREETMGSFTTSRGVKVTSGTVGTEQRGQVQGDEESARPDFVWFDDFETRLTLRSAITTKMIWDNMEEARTGLSSDGGCVYTMNYVSERGNVHRLIERHHNAPQYSNLLDIGITHDKTLTGDPSWSEMHDTKDIERMHATDDDFWGERMNKPSAGFDIMFNRERIDAMQKKEPIKVTSGFHIFHEFDPSHRYGGGADIAGGVGIDSSTSCFIDFSTVPARVVGTFASNRIKPDAFGYELLREAEMFGNPILAPENNKFDEAIGVLKHNNYPNIYMSKSREDRILQKIASSYGWETNRLTKYNMISGLVRAVDDGLIELSDERLIREARTYSRDDLMDREVDVRLTTRHFDILIAAAIAWQMKDYAKISKPDKKKIDNYLTKRENRTKSLYMGR